MFGYLIPRTIWKRSNLTQEFKNNKWYDAIELEMESMPAYKVFKSGIKQFLTNTKGS